MCQASLNRQELKCHIPVAHLYHGHTRHEVALPRNASNPTTSPNSYFLQSQILLVWDFVTASHRATERLISSNHPAGLFWGPAARVRAPMHGELLVILGPQPQTTKEIAVRKTLAGLRGADLALGAVTISMVQGTVHGALAQGTRRNFVSARRLDTAR